MKPAKSHIQLCVFLLGIFPFMVNGWINANIYQNLWLFWSFELFSWVILPIVILIYLFKYQGMQWADLGLHALINGQRKRELVVFLCVVLFFLDYPIYQASLSFATRFVHSEPLFSYQTMAPNMHLLKMIEALYFGLTAGIVEEIYYRGLLYKVLSQYANPIWLYMIFSPLLFGISHWEQGMQNVLATWIFGIFSALFYLKFRNLWPLIVGHVATDYVWFS